MVSFLERRAANIKSANCSETSEYIENIIRGAEKYKESPLDASGSLASIDAGLSEAVYLYFLTKQTVAIYEAKINYIPLQIYNELRNSLDHYCRAIINVHGTPEDNIKRRESHVHKMVGHLQRALFDVIKLTCAAVVEKIEKTHRQIGEKSISVVSNGDYYKEITQRLATAEQLYAEAKICEHSIGNGDENVVRDKYLRALSAHLQAQEYQNENLANLHWGRAKMISMKTGTLLITVIAGAISGYLVRVLWAASENLPIIKFIVELAKKLFG